MAQKIPNVTVSIQNHDKPVVYRNLILNQTVCGHHYFSFIWNIGNISHDSGSQLDVVKNNIGSTISIQFEDHVFNGIITQITVQEQTSTSQSFTIKGQSLSIVIDDVPKSATYYKKNLQKIIKSTLESVPGNVMKTEVSPTDSEEKHYVVQYNETDFQFLSRLAIRYGEWFYYDGTTLVFGKPGDSNAVLKSGSNLTNYIIQANIKASKFSFKSYDYHKGEPVNKELSSFSSDVKNDFSTAVADKSKEVYTRADDRPMHNFNLSNKKMVDAAIELETKRIASQMLFAKGSSKHHALRPGYKFIVETSNGNYDYIATNVTHISNVAGHYENSFVAIPATVKVPPYTDPHLFREAGTQTALVKENHDTDGVNRVKVQFHWQKSADMTPWIRVGTPHAGSGKGFHFIPEKGEEVIVAFDGGDVEKPFVVNSIFHGGAKSGSGDSDNNVKSFATRSGNKVSLDDSAGSILIVDKAGNQVQIDGSGNITISSSASITLKSKDIVLKADEGIVLDAKNIMLTASEDIVLDAGKDASISGKQNANLGSDMKVAVAGKMSVEIQSNTKVSVFSAAQLELMGSAMNTITGGIVKIN
ncbi:MAG: hypothetical protein IPP71_09555 [Bacteroidetes bacterium]|nr:hypothetical protein [Bacteroidota bacterium]